MWFFNFGIDFILVRKHWYLFVVTCLSTYLLTFLFSYLYLSIISDYFPVSGVELGRSRKGGVGGTVITFWMSEWMDRGGKVMIEGLR